MNSPRKPHRFGRSAARAGGLGVLAIAAALAAVAESGPLVIQPTKITEASNPYGDSNPTWSPDGSRIVYESRDLSLEYPSLFYKDMPSGAETRMTGAGEPAPDYEHPNYSPDGSRLVYTKKDGTWYHLYVRPAGGGPETALTAGAAGPSVPGGYYGDLCPAWSRDGQWIAFASSRGDPDFGMFDLWVVGADGEGLKRITYGYAGDTGWPSWAPGDARIVFSQNDEVWEVARTGPATWGAPVLLWDGGSHPSFSPDGAKIAYQHGGDILARTYPGGPVMAVTSGPGDDQAACWSPDGKAIAFSSDREDGNRALWVATGIDLLPATPTTLGRVKAAYR